MFIFRFKVSLPFFSLFSSFPTLACQAYLPSSPSGILVNLVSFDPVAAGALGSKRLHQIDYYPFLRPGVGLFRRQGLEVEGRGLELL